jgi:hypothetical protein
MNHTLKLLLPIGLGLAAAIVNLSILSAKSATVEFVGAGADIPRGAQFSDKNLTKILVPGTEAGYLNETAITWPNRGILLGQSTARDVIKGELILYQDFGVQGARLHLNQGEEARRISLVGLNISDDILKIGDQLRFLIDPTGEGTAEWHGPCRLVAVGDRVTNSILGAKGSSRAVVESVWIAVPKSASYDPVRAALDQFARRQQEDNARVADVSINRP